MGFGGLVLAITPGEFLRHYPATAALHAPLAVEEENQKAPERNELKAPLGKMIVTRRRLVAPGADRRGTLARTHLHFDGLFVGAKAGPLVDKAPLVVAVI